MITMVRFLVGVCGHSNEQSRNIFLCERKSSLVSNWDQSQHPLSSISTKICLFPILFSKEFNQLFQHFPTFI